MSDFKLLAIRPLKDCNPDYLKVLKPNMIYQFYQDYDIELDEKKEKIKPIRRIYPELNFYSKEGIKPQINISAIVGKNGSGKSSIAELIHATLYNISVITRKLYRFDEQKLDSYYLINDINVELVFESGKNVNILTLNNELLFFNGNLWKHTDKDEINKKILEQLFYTLSINFSHYSLNAMDYAPVNITKEKILAGTYGDEQYWLNNLFHKNDGYQAPIVISPFRQRGSIDIENETYLTKSRLISFIVSSQKPFFIFPGKKVFNVKFKFIESKLHDSSSDDLPEHRYIELLKIVDLDYLSNKFSDFKISEINLSNSDSMFERIKYYIMNKLYSITQKYYKAYSTLLGQNVPKNNFDQKNYEEFIDLLAEDKSHITYKLRQTINFCKNIDSYLILLKHNWIVKDGLDNNWVDIDVFSSQIIKYQTQLNDELIFNIPPPFFEFDLSFDNRNESTFKYLSSGEKQFIFTTYSILYHFKNIDSVNDKRDKSIVKYRNVNLFLDEIELYYHPEMQRRYINDLIFAINEIDFKSIEGINIMLLTHSPFILSDIPHNNILKLVNGNPFYSDKSEKTFGANIYDLLRHDFYLEKGFIGAFAMSKIAEVLSYISEEKYDSDKHQYFSKVTDLIADEIINTKLNQLLNELYLESLDKNTRELERLLLQREQIEAKIKSLRNHD